MLGSSEERGWLTALPTPILTIGVKIVPFLRLIGLAVVVLGVYALFVVVVLFVVVEAVLIPIGVVVVLR